MGKKASMTLKNDVEGGTYVVQDIEGSEVVVDSDGDVKKDVGSTRDVEGSVLLASVSKKGREHREQRVRQHLRAMER